MSGPIVVTSANRAAYDVLKMVADEPAQASNPAVLCGPSGVGKTALLEQMIADLGERSPERSVLVCDTDACVQSLVDSVRSGHISAWKKAMLADDVLVLENAEVLHGKPLIQGEMAFAVRARVSQHRQTVVAITGGPEDVEVFVDRLRSWCDTAVVVEMNKPGFGDRLDLVNQSAASHSVELTARAAIAVARSCETPADVVAVLHHLAFYSEQWHEPVTEPFARWVLARLA